MRAARRRRRHSPRGDRDRGSRTRWSAAAASAYLRAHGVDVDRRRRCETAARAAERAVLHRHAPRPAVRDDEGGAQRSTARWRAGGRAGARLTGAAANRRDPSRARRGRRDRDRLRDGARRRSAADGARRVSAHRPLTRVVFDRRLRTPPAARLFSTLDAGPVIIVTSERDGRGRTACAALERGRRRRSTVVAGDATDSSAAALRAAGATRRDVADARGRADAARGVLDARARRSRPDVRDADGARAGRRAVAGRRRTPSRRRSTTCAPLPLGADVLIEGDVHRAD